MRSGFTPALEEVVQRPDPAFGVVAELLGRELDAEGEAVEDVRQTHSDWVDSEKFQTTQLGLDDGGVRLHSTTEIARAIHQPSDPDTDTMRPLPPLFEGQENFQALWIEWRGGSAGDTFTSFEARLVGRDDSGLPQEVAEWRATVYGVTAIYHDETTYYQLGQLTFASGLQPSVGPDPEDIIFNFGEEAAVPDPPAEYDENGDYIGDRDYPILIVIIDAFDENGDPAGNNGWVVDSDAGTEYDDPQGHQSRPANMSEHDTFTNRYSIAHTGPGVPIFAMFHREFEEGWAQFVEEHKLDLGTTPTGPIELVAEQITPDDTEVEWGIREPGQTEWIEFRDGDIIGEGDLSGLSQRADYEVRATLRPGEAGYSTPIARRVGIRSLVEMQFGLDDYIVQPQTARWSVDAETLRGEISECVITLIRTGEIDYRDPVTELLSDFTFRDVSLSLYIGSPLVPKSEWMLIDRWEFEDYDMGPGPDVSLIAASPVARTKAIVPLWDPAAGERPDIIFTNDTAAYVWQELLTTHARIPDRFLPMFSEAELPSGSPLTRTISGDREITGKALLDGVAWIGGGSILTSQGEVVFKPIIRDIEEEEPVQRWELEEVKVLNITPGKRRRVGEFSVPWYYNVEEDFFENEVVSVNAEAIEADDRTHLEGQERLQDDIAEWIRTADLAEDLAERETTTRGFGVPTAQIQVPYAHPHLEVGDLVSFKTDRYVVRLADGTSIYGVTEIKAIIIEQDGPEGREFLLWLKEFVLPVEHEPEPEPVSTENWDGFNITSDVHGCTQDSDEGAANNQNAPLEIACFVWCDEPACGGPGGWLVWYSNNPEHLEQGCDHPDNPIPALRGLA